MARDRMMEDLKAYRRNLSLRAMKAEREGRGDEFWRKLFRDAEKWYQAQVAEIRRQDAARKRRGRRVSARKIASPAKTKIPVRAPGRRK